MLDLIGAFETNFAKRSKNPNHKFEVKFRSRKMMNSESIVIRSSAWKRKSGMYAWLHAMRTTEALPSTILYDTRLQRTKAGIYYLCILIPSGIRDENHVPNRRRGRVISLDPGVRTFNTCFDPVGRECIKWGDNDVQRIYRLPLYG